ncbi:MAG: DNA repair protein RadC [Rudaea sp.]|uniref:JAB domain-containing protein n=1 Tax=unclassified Rudaea TaxID=2627037 RepID=UPI0010FA014C|nr:MULTISPECIES: JAB domain-containing protein [unclassified Rudaea]MBN8884447.1 DNA repair protein RadC [Rudaea sp.]
METSIVRDLLGNYRLGHTITDQDVLEAAERLLEQRLVRDACLSRPEDAAQYLRMRLAKYPFEVFACVFLDQRHRVLAIEELFRGSIAACSVPIREVLRRVLHHNAAAVILAHQHPSGVSEPSQADIDITRELKTALGYADCRVLDHFVCGATDHVSLAQRGLV